VMFYEKGSRGALSYLSAAAELVRTSKKKALSKGVSA
jgi:hypothetical protein